ncbi:ThiF family adenylyltransferase [Pyxidicoccus fallax]|uniref:ThiF family adenylyltransferase n=1 Tax=Pyxidicoccus fallax TaxID=394095 RepID=A0A848LMB2_9BACT|nr:ThiF family adenylyltransferase [Pyxidicoccus fallax]NMO18773.1 ThiF family adenylyltransferase [Pyxidicoccus fallax]NPC79351.1 ThiF family adenylyltransferase [Pyxidicoccus fallax]
MSLLEHLVHTSLLEEAHILPPTQALMWRKARNVESAAGGRMTIEGHAIQLRVGLTRSFPLHLPEIAIESVIPPLELPHVSSDGKLCFESEANLLLDRRDSWHIIQESVERVRRLLRTLLTGRNTGKLAEEFAQEAVAYWRHLADSRIGCVVDANDHPHPTTVLFYKGTLSAVADNPEVYGQSLARRSSSGATHRNAIYVPIDPVAANPAFNPKELATLEGLRKYVGALPEQDRRTLARLLARLDKSEEFVVLGVRRPQGDRALLGVNLEEIQGSHPLRDEQSRGRVRPVELLRRDRAFLAPRGGASTKLHERRVLIAGCGAVGGYLALILARAGVGQISLLDPDRFGMENAYRHVCGMAWEHEPKVKGLKQEIERLVPYVTVAPYQMRIERFLVEKPDVLRDQDLVISALGEPTIELHLNEWIWSSATHPPVIFAWLEPLGLGGHALVTHVHRADTPARGCLECLYHRVHPDAPLENRAAFAAPGEIYTGDMLGCGSAHLPFADLDAQRTAEAAGRLALRVLRHKIESAPLISWKGDPSTFLQAGFEVTPRFRALSGEFSEDGLTYLRSDCPVCTK